MNSNTIDKNAALASVTKVASTPYVTYLFNTRITNIAGTRAKILAAKDENKSAAVVEGVSANCLRSRFILAT